MKNIQKLKGKKFKKIDKLEGNERKEREDCLNKWRGRGGGIKRRRGMV